MKRLNKEQNEVWEILNTKPLTGFEKEIDTVVHDIAELFKNEIDKKILDDLIKVGQKVKDSYRMEHKN